MMPEVGWPLLTRGALLGGAVAESFLALKWNAAKQLVIAEDDTEHVAGIGMFKGALGDRIGFTQYGVVSVKLGAAVSRGQILAPGAGGKLVPWSGSRLKGKEGGGAAANVNIAVDGIKLTDRPVVAARVDSAVGEHPFTIQADGQIRIAVNTATQDLLVLWERGILGTVGVAADDGAENDIIFCELARGRA